MIQHRFKEKSKNGYFAKKSIGVSSPSAENLAARGRVRGGGQRESG